MKVVKRYRTTNQAILITPRDKTHYAELPHIPRIYEGYGVFFYSDTSKIPIKSPLELILLWLSPLPFYPFTSPIYSYVCVTSVTIRR